MVIKEYSIKKGNEVILYTVGYQWNDTQSDIINSDTSITNQYKVTCYDETDKKYIYSNVNNMLVMTYTNGKIKITATFTAGHSYLLTFYHLDEKTEDKIVKIRLICTN